MRPNDIDTRTESLPADALMTSLLASSTEYAIIGQDLDGNILFWNEGARKLYGYDSDEVAHKPEAEILHSPDDVSGGRPQEVLKAALKDGKWEGTLDQVRKSGERFTARVEVTLGRDANAHASGFLYISRDISSESRLAEDLRNATLFDPSIMGSTEEAVDFVTNILQASTEYSIVGKGLDGTILLWNEGARRLYGYEPEEVVGKANSSILHTAEDVKAGVPKQTMETALREGKWEGTLQRVRRNGERFTARVVITPRRDSNGRPAGFLLISKDVSSEIRLTEQLKATQFYTRSLIESNIDALMTTDPLGVITDVNQQMEALTGYARDQLIGTPFKNYFTSPDRAEEGIRLVLREGKVTNYELTALSKDGRMTVVSYNASTFRDGAGKLQGVFAAARDITEQKNLEAQLRESEAYNRGLIEASVDGLITVSAAGLISDVNEQMARMSGYTREELIGTAFADYFMDSENATRGIR